MVGLLVCFVKLVVGIASLGPLHSPAEGDAGGGSQGATNAHEGLTCTMASLVKGSGNNTTSGPVLQTKG